MGILNVSDSTSERVADIARAWGISEDAAIVRLIEHWRGPADTPTADSADEVHVHAIYGGQRASGVYRPGTKTIDLISGPGAGRTGLKPSAACAEVIKAVNPKVSPSRNGWSFWVIDQNRELLQTIRYT